jgi:uracil-DNA glycosylase family protein
MATPDGAPGAAPWVPTRPSLRSLRSAAQGCRGCDLWEHATQAVVGDGPLSAALMVVGEQPGDKEDLAGEPFVGPAGRLLDRALEEAGISPDSVFRTNAVKHFRHAGTRGKQRIHKSPSRWQVAACGPWLLAELKLVQPRVVVLLGATAGQSVYGASFRVGASRGRALEWPADRIPVHQPPAAVVATVHPSSVLRSRSREQDRAALVADLRAASELC